MAKIDPNIVLGAVSQQRPQMGGSLQNLQQVIQLQNLIEQQRARKAETQKAQTLRDIQTRHIQPTEGGIELQQGPFLQELAQTDPGLAIKQQQLLDQRRQESQLREAQVKAAQAQKDKFLKEGSLKDLEIAEKELAGLSSTAGSVLSNPTIGNLQAGLDLEVKVGRVTPEGAQQLLSSVQVDPVTGLIDDQSINKLKTFQMQSVSALNQVKLAKEKKEKETPEEKSVRERREQQEDLAARLPEGLTVKKNRKIANKDVEKVQDQLTFSKEAKSLIDRAKNAANKIKGRGSAFLKGLKPGDPEFTALQSEIRALQLLEKGPEGSNLGVLAGPDLSLLNAITGDPDALDVVIKSPQSLINKLNRMEDRLVNKTKVVLDSRNVSGFKKDMLSGMSQKAADLSKELGL